MILTCFCEDNVNWATFYYIIDRVKSEMYWGRRIYGILFIYLGLTGCGPLASTPGSFNLISTQAELFSIVGTEKTIADHVVSLGSGKNCSTVRRERGLHYCEEDTPNVKPDVYCYKTLARVTCYNRPDPFINGSKRLGSNDHNLVDQNRQRE